MRDGGGSEIERKGGRVVEKDTVREGSRDGGSVLMY